MVTTSSRESPSWGALRLLIMPVVIATTAAGYLGNPAAALAVEANDTPSDTAGSRESASPPGAAENADSSPAAAPSETVRDLIAAGKLDQALAKLTAQLAAEPDNDEIRLQHARMLYWKGEYRRALEEATQVLMRHPADAECMELVSSLRLALGDVRGALAMLQAMQDVGDMRPAIQQRIVDLLMVLEDLHGVTIALRGGGKLTDEQQLQFAAAQHPWLWGAGTALTLYRDQKWPRFEGMAGHRFGKHLTLTGSAHLERRDPGGLGQWAWSGMLGAYLNTGALDIAAFVGGSPSEAFLPGVDVRLDGSYALSNKLGLGLWARWARYAPQGAPQSSPLTLAPNVVLTSGRWTFNPGWLLLYLDASGWAHTASLKIRFDNDPRTAWLLWLYAGQDPNFVDRLTAQPTSGVTALVGVDRWVTNQLALRLSASRIQPLGDYPSFSEFALSLRGRL